jgi:acyl-CoA synthetase (AMP-forming)/AMP-acid ligase II
MPTINQLPLLSKVSPGDQFVLYTPNNGDARRLPVNELLQFFQQTFAAPSLATNLFTPGTGFNIPVPTPVSQQQWILIQPAGTLAVGAVTLPLNTLTPDGTEVLITTTQQITAFTLNANGAAQLYGVPTTLAAEDHFRVRYFQSTNSWYTIA